MREIRNAVLQFVAFVFIVLALVFGILSAFVLLPSVICKVIGEGIGRLALPTQSDILAQLEKVRKTMDRITDVTSTPEAN